MSYIIRWLVARSTRAWIETFVWFGGVLMRWSHALRVRGLKQSVSDDEFLGGVRRTLYACVD